MDLVMQLVKVVPVESVVVVAVRWVTLELLVKAGRVVAVH